MRIRFYLRAWIVLASVSLLIAGCSERRVKKSEDVPPLPPLPGFGPPLTEQDYLAFGIKLEKAFAKSDREMVERLCRNRDIEERCASNLDLPFSSSKKANRDTNSLSGFLKGVIHHVQNGGLYRSIGVRDREGVRRLVVRFLHANGGFDYHEVFLVRYPDGEVAAEDFYVLSSGEKYSQSIRRVYSRISREFQQANSAKNNVPKTSFLKNVPAIVSMAQATRGHQSKEILETYAKLPIEIQTEKMLLDLAIAAAKQVDLLEFKNLVKRLRKYHPESKAIDYWVLDLHLMQKEYDQALPYLARLEEAVGGDTYLRGLKAYAKFKATGGAEAKGEIEKAIEQEPTLNELYDLRINLALDEKNHADTAVWLKKSVERSGEMLELADFERDHRYAEFMKSPESNEIRKLFPFQKK